MIDAADLRYDTFRSWGDPTGPVHAVLRVTHEPTGISVSRRVMASSSDDADAELRQARPEMLREIEERLNGESE
jgi:protein subunit release factor A